MLISFFCHTLGSTSEPLGHFGSPAGFTPQYTEMTELYNKYAAKGLEVLAFPCNQVGFSRVPMMRAPVACCSWHAYPRCAAVWQPGAGQQQRDQVLC